MNTQTFPLTGPINLDVRLGRGTVVVTAADDLAEATVTLVPRDKNSDILDRITVGLTGPTLSVQAPRQGGLADLLGGWRDKDAVDATVTVPTGTAMKLQSYTADITVRGRSGGVDLATGSGAVELDVVGGDLRIRCGSSTAKVTHVDGSAHVRTGSGSLRIGSVNGDLQAGFGSGDLEVGTAHGTVRSRSGSGDARVDAVFGDVDLAAGAGGISIGLPAGVTARLDVVSGSGDVRSDLPIENRPSGRRRPISVRARTGSGSVRLFRATAAA